MYAEPVVTGEIVRDPAIFGGEPILQGTRIGVANIVCQLRYEGTIAGVIEAFPRLTPVAVDAALRFYEANRAEIDRIIAELEAGDIAEVASPRSLPIRRADPAKERRRVEVVVRSHRFALLDRPGLAAAISVARLWFVTHVRSG